MIAEVSIIVPVYQVEDYIDQCIQSLVCQTFNNIEIILVDDGSTDKSGEICDSWSIKDKRIKSIHTENRGVSFARNIGINEAVGHWICFVDGDDYADNQMIEIMYEQAKKSDSDIVIGDYTSSAGSHTKVEYFFENKCKFNQVNRQELILDTVLEKRTNITSVGVPWGKLYRTEFIKHNNLEFYIGLKRKQDIVFNIECFINANVILYIHEPIYYYRKNINSATHKYAPKYEDTLSLLSGILEQLGTKYNIMPNWDEILFAKRVGFFSECVRLSYCHKDCPLNLREKIRNVKRLSHKFLNNEISISNPYLTRVQQILLICVKLKMYTVIYILLKIRQVTR